MGFFRMDQLADSHMKSSRMCGQCKLNRECVTRRMPAAGQGNAQLMIIGEAPGAEEDKRGIPFIGPCGKYLAEILPDRYDLDEDCVRTNAVCCRPPHNRKPTPAEIAGCRPVLMKEIKKAAPKVILLLGGVALESVVEPLLGKSPGAVSKWRGNTIPNYDLNAWIVPTFHPSYVMREIHYGEVDWSRKNSRGYGSAAEVIFRQDVQTAFRCLRKTLPLSTVSVDKVTLLRTPSHVLNVLDSIDRDALLAFDYETSGLKSDREGHYIACASFCFDLDEAFCFPGRLFKNEKVLAAWKRILEDPDQPKTAHNQKYEYAWSFNVLGIDIQGFVIDTIVACHVLDNRQGVKSLKHQLFVRYGVKPYDGHIQPYFHSSEINMGDNSFNRIDEAPEDDLMIYCGMDSLGGLQLAYDCLKELEI